MFCSSCGTQLPAGAAICPRCRTAISSDNATTVATPYVAPSQTPAPSTNYGSTPYGAPAQNAYQPLNPYASPPPPPPPPRRKAKTGLIIGSVVLVLILASVGIFALSRPPTPNNVVEKPTTSSNATAQTNSTITPTALPTTATATGNIEALPYSSYHGTLALSDALKDNNNNNFGEANDSSGDTCQFTGGSYHVGQSTGKSTALCVAPSTDFSNFVYEVQMTTVKGDGGGLFFRADFNSTKLYLFFVGANGLYALGLYTDGSHFKPLKNSALSSAINKGLNQSNLIAVGASGNTITLYINHQQVMSINDSTYSHGQIGLVAEPYTDSVNPTEVAFSNAKVWTLSG